MLVALLDSWSMHATSVPPARIRTQVLSGRSASAWATGAAAPVTTRILTIHCDRPSAVA